PAEPAVGDAAPHFVLAADEIAARKPGNKRERCAALGAEALGAPGFSVASASDRFIAVGVAAESMVLRDLRIGQDRLGRIAPRNRRGSKDPPAQAPPGA